ncbi:MAG: hypothetical protein IAE99_08360 [Rhodothermales bacterium]|nr:hypothetical protein [Rhodothermales bacterium]
MLDSERSNSTSNAELRGFACPECGSGSRVSQTRSLGSVVVRERVCRNPACRHVFDTREIAARVP